MVEAKIPISFLKIINDIIDSEAVKQKDIPMNVEGKKVYIKIAHPSGASGFRFTPLKELDVDTDEPFELWLELSDSKDFVSLADGEQEALFKVDDGQYRAQVGDVKMKMPKPIDIPIMKKFPELELPAKMELTPEQVVKVNKAASKVKGDKAWAYVTMTEQEVTFGFDMDSPRSIEITLPKEELLTFENEGVKQAIFPLQMFGGMFKLVPKDTNLTLTFDKDMPILSTFSIDMGIVNIIIAPIIEQD